MVVTFVIGNQMGVDEAKLLYNVLPKLEKLEVLDISSLDDESFHYFYLLLIFRQLYRRRRIGFPHFSV